MISLRILFVCLVFFEKAFSCQVWIILTFVCPKTCQDKCFPLCFALCVNTRVMEKDLAALKLGFANHLWSVPLKRQFRKDFERWIFQFPFHLQKITVARHFHNLSFVPVKKQSVSHQCHAVSVMNSLHASSIGQGKIILH